MLELLLQQVVELGEEREVRRGVANKTLRVVVEVDLALILRGGAGGGAVGFNDDIHAAVGAHALDEVLAGPEGQEEGRIAVGDVGVGKAQLEVKGGVGAGKRLMDSVELCTLAENLGSVETLITHPVTMTHADVEEAERRRVGITDGLVRLSVGLEDVEDLIADLAGALERI